jgi:hypothetical protein
MNEVEKQKAYLEPHIKSIIADYLNLNSEIRSNQSSSINPMRIHHTVNANLIIPDL